MKLQPNTKRTISVLFICCFLFISIIPSVNASPDIFGYTSKGMSGIDHMGNQIRGSWFTCLDSGQADSMTVWIYHIDYTYDVHVKLAIYKKSDSSLVAYTEELIFGSLYDTWATFDVVWGGSLTAQDYWLEWWTDDPASVFLGVPYYIPLLPPTKGGYDLETYNDFPDSISIIGVQKKYSIYCTYTPAPTAEWHSVEVWYGDLITRQWSGVETWFGDLITREWSTVESWYGDLITRSWQPVETWFGELVTKGWHTIESWYGNLIGKGWQHIETWHGVLTQFYFINIIMWILLLTGCFLLIIYASKK